VDASLHIAFEEFELFALTLTLESGKEVMDFLEADLAFRQKIMNETGALIARQFQASFEPSRLMNISSW